MRKELTEMGQIISLLRKHHDESSRRLFREVDGQAQIKVFQKAPSVIPGSTDADQVRGMAEARGILPYEGMESRTLAYWASDERVDNHGDIVRQTWVLEQFQKNSILPFSHGWNGTPVGRSINEVVTERNESDYTGPALQMLALFNEEGVSELSDDVARLALSGMMRGCSVGFQPGRIIDVVDEEERRELGLGKWGVVMEDNILLELSPTMIPANSGALSIMQRSARDGMLRSQDVDMIRAFSRESLKDWVDEEEINKQDAQYKTMGRVVFDDYKERSYSIPKPLAKDSSQDDSPEELVQRIAELEQVIKQQIPEINQKLDDVRSLVERFVLASFDEDSKEGAETKADTVTKLVDRLEKFTTDFSVTS